MSAVQTFREAEEQLGIVHTGVGQKSALEVWYDEIREKRFTDFSDGDLARTLRQDLYIDWILPHVMNRLSEDPLAGDLYEGELISALMSLPGAIGPEHEPLIAQINRLFESGAPEPDDERIFEVLELLRQRFNSS